MSRRLVQVSARLGLGWYAPEEMADGWQQDLVDFVLGRVISGDGQRMLALACLAFGLEAMGRIGFETVSSAVCSNFEVICRAMVERDVLARAVAPEVVVSNALLGLGALGLLKARGFVQEGASLDSLRERLQEALTDGWERANPLQMPVWSSLPEDSVLRSYILAARELSPVEQLSRPAIVLAMRHAGEVTLPVPGDQLLVGTRI